ncbi:hypothetical protein B296_00041708 [Ensete ventricosum]|uniref:Uncharacterized protein n=1 Tax=Ensete ventricosum TaxID=4639 RepID=A0A426Z4S2_ENSVE|nr:hypothetical protein B296_00041708 [Ensete ventricosum]
MNRIDNTVRVKEQQDSTEGNRVYEPKGQRTDRTSTSSKDQRLKSLTSCWIAIAAVRAGIRTPASSNSRGGSRGSDTTAAKPS